MSAMAKGSKKRDEQRQAWESGDLSHSDHVFNIAIAFAGVYRAEKRSLQILLSSTQAGPGRKLKQEQEEISRNHVPRLFLCSVGLQRRK